MGLKTWRWGGLPVTVARGTTMNEKWSVPWCASWLPSSRIEGTFCSFAPASSNVSSGRGGSCTLSSLWTSKLVPRTMQNSVFHFLLGSFFLSQPAFSPNRDSILVLALRELRSDRDPDGRLVWGAAHREASSP